MPISNEALENPQNRFIAVTADAKLGQAIAALESFGGHPWWHLVVERDDGLWSAAKFSELGALFGAAPDPAEIRLGNADALTAIPATEQNAIETKAARALARTNPRGLLIVTNNGRPVGILVEGTTRAAAAPSQGAGGLVAPSANLDQLGGKYIKLRDYGRILLGGSKK